MGSGKLDNPKILIVEDESIVAKDLKQRLENMGYSVLGIVSNGKDAISKLNEMQPDIILIYGYYIKRGFRWNKNSPDNKKTL